MSKERLLPLTGVLFILLLIASFAVAGEPPDADEDVQEIVEHYVDNETGIWIGAGLFGAAALSLLVFASYLRNLFSDAAAGRGLLPGLVLVGASIVVVGGAIDTTIQVALVEAADEIEPDAVQALQALWDNDFVPIAVGIATMLLSIGVLTVQTGALPKWIGWIALALLVIGFTPIGFVAFPGMGVLILIISILLAVRAGRTTTA